MKGAADIIAEPITHIFNLSLLSNSIPKFWKAAYFLPLLKGGDPAELNNYPPILKLSVLAKLHQRSINLQLKQFLAAKNISNDFPWGCGTGHSAAAALVTSFVSVLSENTVLLYLLISSRRFLFS